VIELIEAGVIGGLVQALVMIVAMRLGLLPYYAVFFNGNDQK
jgi:hypothetical protein